MPPTTRIGKYLDHPQGAYALEYEDTNTWAYVHPVWLGPEDRAYRLVLHQRAPDSALWHPSASRYYDLVELAREMRRITGDLRRWRVAARSPWSRKYANSI